MHKKRQFQTVISVINKIKQGTVIEFDWVSIMRWCPQARPPEEGTSESTPE